MVISLNPAHLRRYRDLALLLVKYGRGDLVAQSGLGDVLEEAPAEEASVARARAEDLAADLERLGPTFIKLGQLLSTRPDLLPKEYIEALTRLQDSVGAFPYEDVERIVNAELGRPVSEAFLELEREPMGVASLGQVHRARLHDGRRVVVKVQRPDIHATIVDDLDALGEVAGFLDAYTETGRRFGLSGLLEEFRRSMLAELDYRKEASNLACFVDNLREFDEIVVPLPVPELTTSRVLTMDFVQGRKITDVSPLGRLDVDGRGLADALFRAYLKQILVDGFFHADPHPGNVLLTHDGRIGLLDLGMVGRVAPEVRDVVLRLLVAVSEGRGGQAAELALDCGTVLDGADTAEFRRRVTRLVLESQNTDVTETDAGRVMLELTRDAAACGVRLPQEFAMMAKTLLNLDQVVSTLDPAFDPSAAMRRHAAEILNRQVWSSFAPGGLLSTLGELAGMLRAMPAIAGRALDRLGSGGFRVNLDVVDEVVLMQGMQKVANRITLGLVLAALIVGASMLMEVETSFRILGYPGLAILLFFAAAAGGLGFVISIVVGDARRR